MRFFFFFKLNLRCSGFINICYSDQLLGYKTSFTQRKKKKKKKKKKKTYTKLKCTQIHLFPELSIAEKIPLKSNAAKEKKEKKKGFRVELRAKSNFKSNARGKLRQTIYFFGLTVLKLS